MRIVEIATGPGRSIEQFDSVGAAHLGGARFSGAGGMAFLSLAAGSHLGRHPTMLPQLFCVVRGEGWVAGEDGQHQPIHAGQAALWRAGEEHDSGSSQGMEVVVLEAEALEIR